VDRSAAPRSADATGTVAQPPSADHIAVRQPLSTHGRTVWQPPSNGTSHLSGTVVGMVTTDEGRSGPGHVAGPVPWVPARDDERAPPPRAVPPSSWMLPAPSQADPDGVVGIGADLAPGTLVDAYRNGIFPWPHEGVALPWFAPDPRGIIELDQVHVSRSLRRTLRRSGWVTTMDQAFDAVVAGCAHERSDDGTWITDPMRRAYIRLHQLGWAHSIEVWDDGHLVGGLYGVQVGAVFTGESMFHLVSDASKVALVDLCDRFAEARGAFFDVQLTTPHLQSLGAVDVPRATFVERLHAARDLDVRLPIGPRPVSRLARSA
jgi:leucyl/phenylalanyl-tRNA---protein transferase